MWCHTGCWLNSFYCFCCSRTNKALADSLDQAVDHQDPLVNRLLRMMATAAMSQARYFCTGVLSQDQAYHYGNSERCCDFTIWWEVEH